MAELLEVAMLLAFGAAWPVSIAKSYRSRTTTGKSILFLCIVAFGYMCGIGSKFVADRVNYVVVFYVVNLLVVLMDIGLYVRNRHLDQLAKNAAVKE